MTEFKNKNLIARIRFNEFNNYYVNVVQIVNTGLEIVEDYFHGKSGFKTLAGAQKFAQKIIN